MKDAIDKVQFVLEFWKSLDFGRNLAIFLQNVINHMQDARKFVRNIANLKKKPPKYLLNQGSFTWKVLISFSNS